MLCKRCERSVLLPSACSVSPFNPSYFASLATRRHTPSHPLCAQILNQFHSKLRSVFLYYTQLEATFTQHWPPHLTFAQVWNCLMLVRHSKVEEKSLNSVASQIHWMSQEQANKNNTTHLLISCCCSAAVYDVLQGQRDQRIKFITIFCCCCSAAVHDVLQG